MQISIVVASSSNGVIGMNGKMPWHLPIDLKRFRDLTLGHYVIMGRKTYESIGKALPKRDNIVLSSDKNFAGPGKKIIVFSSIEESLDYIKDWEDFASMEAKVFVIGGQNVYDQVLNKGIVTDIYQTVIKQDFEGDTFFRIPETDSWKIIDIKEFKKNKNNPYDYSFCHWQKSSEFLGKN